MTEISFYVGQHQTLRDRLLLACRLVEKARQVDMHVHIHTDGFITSKKMDELLWTWNDTSFIPHTTNITSPIQEPVTIADDFEPMENCDYLINLSNQRPNFFSRYKKMAEIIDQTETILTAGRERYSFYKHRGYNLKYYQL